MNQSAKDKRHESKTKTKRKTPQRRQPSERHKNKELAPCQRRLHITTTGAALSNEKEKITMINQKAIAARLLSDEITDLDMSLECAELVIFEIRDNFFGSYGHIAITIYINTNM